jgi:uncharacterized protein
MDAARPTPIPGTPLSVRDDVPLASIPAAAWDALTDGGPLLSHAFLLAFEATGCAAPATGWRPQHLTAWSGQRLVGALPLYAKSHSFGEYVFDWAWADAYRRHGRRYYPKLIAAIPFTPTPGPRLLGADRATRAALLDSALARLRTSGPSGTPYSSLHVLFPTADDVDLCASAGMTVRHGLQFRLENPGYRDFGDFLAAFNHDKRKKVKQERRRVAEAGIRFVRKTGREITSSDWEFFHQCYENTYLAHGSTPYLSLAFFERIGATMPEQLLLILGVRGGQPVCAALDVFGATTLWGRYWGAIEYQPGLHFEACYYQAIEFCIERGIRRFEGGAQGLHKLARGLTPVRTWSAHAIADPDFASAIADYCRRERVEVGATIDELESSTPYRVGG